MRLPPDDAVIPAEKLRDYLLSPAHPEGRGKAAYLGRIGYGADDAARLAVDLRRQHLVLEAQPSRPSPWGTKYEIVGELAGPNGKVAWVRTVWMVLSGETVPRLVTLIPENRP